MYRAPLRAEKQQAGALLPPQTERVTMFHELEKINERPGPFEVYTARDLWTGEHTSRRMLEYHLDGTVDAASRNTDFINRSADWIARHFGLDENSDVIDFGCGLGLYTSRFASSGAKVTGIDFSRRSLEYASGEAKRNGLDIRYIHSDYLEYDTDERFDLVTMIMCDFAALSPLQRSRLLGKFRSLLKQGGSVLLDVYTLGYFNSRREEAIYEFNQLDGFWSGEDYYCFVNRFKYEAEKLLLDKYTIVARTWTRQVYNWLQCFSEQSIREEFARHGLPVGELYSSVAGDAYDPRSHEMAVVARR
jgi:SAM-dependent methyltransferase